MDSLVRKTFNSSDLGFFFFKMGINTVLNLNTHLTNTEILRDSIMIQRSVYKVLGLILG